LPIEIRHSVMQVRFNFNGSAPRNSRKVGLLDPFQIWSYIVDPYREELVKSISIEPNLIQQVNGMFAFFLKNVNDDAIRREIRQDFNDYYSCQGKWMHHFVGVTHHNTFLDDANKKLSLDDVSEWVTKTGGHHARLQFFSLVPGDNKLYCKVIEPLLSVRTTGSIAVERVAKPMKNDVLTKFRQRLSEERSELCLRVGMNLAFLKNVDMSLKKRS